MLPCEGGEALAQVSHGRCGRAIPGSDQNAFGWGFDQPGLGEGVHALGRGWNDMIFPSSFPTQPNLWLCDDQCCFSEILGCYNPRGDVWMLCWLITTEFSHKIFHPQLVWAIFSMYNHSYALPTPNVASSSPSWAGFSAQHGEQCLSPGSDLWLDMCKVLAALGAFEIKCTFWNWDYSCYWADVELFILLGIFSNHFIIILVVFIAYILRAWWCEWMKDCLPPSPLHKQPGALSALNIYPEVGWMRVGRGEKLWKQKELLPKVSFEDLLLIF